MSARFGRNKRRMARAERNRIVSTICENLKDGAKYKTMIATAWAKDLDNNIFNWLRHGADAF